MPTLALVFSGVGKADIIAPGSAGVPDVFTLVNPTLLELVSDPFSNANESGTVLAAVISDPTNPFGAGNLDFVYQIDTTRFARWLGAAGSNHFHRLRD
ncbi:MAG TPA: hypothetical protein VEV37_02650 [Bryobacteraceae bacterium]|nr:hypothetical protein [Bryobacteraceae bacterium]